jgi:hypothetical protein
MSIASWVALICTILLTLLSFAVSLHEETTKKYRLWVWSALLVLALTASGATVWQARESSAEAIGLATGGDTFAYLDPQIDDAHNAVVSLVVMNQGGYPLRSVNVRIVFIDAAGRDSIAPRTVQDPFQNDMIFPMDPLAAHQASFIQIPKPLGLEGDHVKWNVFFTALNGSWTDLVRLHRVNGHWVKAFKVIWKGTDGVQNKEVYQQVDSAFPTPVAWD